ncbi:IS630 family transposase [Nodosilinea sp. AN01ver1]|uniref:IS630 family transposase n=1 Tax=Nodosilinea sp. AN01ver1 TaxID=3423362 RepID=UPI003D321EA7
MKAYSLDFREKIIDVYFTEHVSVRKLAQRFGVSKSFVETLLKRLRETGDILPKPHGGGVQPKLNAEQLKLVKALVDADNDATLDELRGRLAAETSILMSRSSMGRIVQKLELTRKKKTLYATEAASARVRQARVEYWQAIRDVAAENLVFMDEAGVNLAMIRLYARALKGQRAVGERPAKRGQNVSLVNALSLRGPLAPLTILGSMDSMTFEAYIVRRVAPNLWPGAVLVVDNSPTHKATEEVITALEAVGARLMFLPPYSPDFSPIEPFWSKVKTILDSVGARTHQVLQEAIESAYSQVTLKDIRSWFTNDCYCTSSE